MIKIRPVDFIVGVLAVIVVAVVAVEATAAERLYQWVDPNSGVTQLSGQAPAWYRGRLAGPRVFVFESGRLVDDTGVAVSVEQRLALRAAAFGSAGAAPLQAPPAGSAISRPAPAGIPDAPAAGGAPVMASSDSSAPPAESENPQSTEANVERLRALINAWDTLRAVEARRILEGATDF